MANKVSLSIELLNKPDTKIIAIAAKICYASDIENSRDMTDEEAESFIAHLSEIGHESPFEHIGFTFLIRGVSRALSHQLVRHRIASYSQRSQRYVTESNLDYILPDDLCTHHTLYKKAMESAEEFYNLILKDLFVENIKRNILNKQISTTEATGFADFLTLNNHVKSINEIDPTYGNTTLKKLALTFLSKKEVNSAEKKSAENARYVLPNATATDIVVTMNTRALMHFFSERMCFRAQNEIYEMAWGMKDVLLSNGYSVFKNAGAKCVKIGYCPEGDMCCGFKRPKDRVIFNNENCLL
jgi:thymidylate synthase (FAD)